MSSADHKWEVDQMAKLTPSDVHIDTALSNILIAYKNDDYIADKIFPVVPVKKRSDKYFIFDKGDWFRDEAGLRAPGTIGPQGGFSLTSSTYECKEYSFTTYVEDEVRENADNPLQPDQDATAFAMDKILLRRERIVASMVFSSSNWTSSTTLSGTTQWSDFANSDPIGNIETAKETIRGLIGRYPNTMVMGAAVWSKLKQHPDLLARFQNVERGILTLDMLKDLFEIDNIFVGKAIYNTAAEGATDSFSDVWGKACWIGYVTPRPGLREPSAGYIFQVNDIKVERWREAPEKRDAFRVLAYFDAKVTSADSGYYIAAAVA